jgi:periplasmic protein TonB
VTARVVASAALHLLVGVILATAAPCVQRPSTVDIEIVAPVLVVQVPAAVPSVDPGHDSGQRGDRGAERAPARYPEPARTLPRAHRAAPLSPAPPTAASAAPELPAAEPSAPPDEVTPSEPVSGDDAQGSGGAGEGAGGNGSGAGNGDGSGVGAIDLSSRPVPLETDTSRTLPYTAEAQRDRISGDVHLVLTIDPLGHVGRATVRHGLGHGLDEIATRLAMQIRFRPARDRTGKPTVGTVRWRFHFQPP